MYILFQLETTGYTAIEVKKYDSTLYFSEHVLFELFEVITTGFDSHLK